MVTAVVTGKSPIELANVTIEVFEMPVTVAVNLPGDKVLIESILLPAESVNTNDTCAPPSAAPPSPAMVTYKDAVTPSAVVAVTVAPVLTSAVSNWIVATPFEFVTTSPVLGENVP